MLVLMNCRDPVDNFCGVFNVCSSFPCSARLYLVHADSAGLPSYINFGGTAVPSARSAFALALVEKKSSLLILDAYPESAEDVMLKGLFVLDSKLNRELEVGRGMERGWFIFEARMAIDGGYKAYTERGKGADGAKIG